MRALGVTRLARVTGLDRTGVEVCCAVRPLGHVLQVCQGKGLTWEAAQASALGEAAELAAAERPPPHRLLFGSAAELSERFEVWLPEAISAATSPALAGPEVVQGWVAARAEERGREGRAGEVLVPASAVFCPPADAPWFGPATAVWTSNGLGAGHTPAAARRHALFEVLEREALNRVLPGGWTEREAVRRLVAWDSPLAARLGRHGFRVFALDCTPLGWAVPVVAALLFDVEGGPLPLVAGYACRARPQAAATAALLEAAQSRVTEIHGAREDVLVSRRQEGAGLFEVLARARPRRALSALPSLTRGRPPAPGLRVATVELPGLPLYVARVFALGFRPSELL